MNNRDKLTQTIKKLLRLSASKGAQPGEAALAMAKARALAAKIGATLSDLELDDDTSYREERWSTGVYVEPRYVYIMTVLDEFFKVRTFKWGVEGVRCGIVIFGLDYNVRLAKEFFNYMADSSYRAWATQKLDVNTKADFMFGFLTAVYRRLEQMRDKPTNAQEQEFANSCMAVVKVDTALDKQVNRRYQLTKPAKQPHENHPRKMSAHSAWFRMGYDKGSEVNLNKQLAAQASA